jgi:predicted O-methyltransferase YrrM
MKYNLFQLGFKYLNYLIFAKNGRGHGIHSPFVYRFVREVLMDKSKYPAYLISESYRKQLLKNFNKIEVLDLGAGGKKDTNVYKQISTIAKYALKPSKYSQLLYRFANIFNYKNIVELGTSLGVTTSYLAQLPQLESLTSLEGAPQIADFANNQFSIMKLQNVKVVTGNFDYTLLDVLKSNTNIDLVYIDGNHEKQPTLNYFNQILQYCNSNTCLIFDDIHWSSGMEEAWKEIKGDERVKLTIDVFFLGFVFLNQEFKAKQNFIVRF